MYKTCLVSPLRIWGWLNLFNEIILRVFLKRFIHIVRGTISVFLTVSFFPSLNGFQCVDHTVLVSAIQYNNQVAHIRTVVWNRLGVDWSFSGEEPRTYTVAFGPLPCVLWVSVVFLSPSVSFTTHFTVSFSLPFGARGGREQGRNSGDLNVRLPHNGYVYCWSWRTDCLFW